MSLKKIFQNWGWIKKPELEITRAELVQYPETRAMIDKELYIDLNTATAEERMRATRQGISRASIENLYLYGLVPREGVLPKDRPVLNAEDREILQRELKNMEDRGLISPDTARELWTRAVGNEIEATAIPDLKIIPH